MDNKKGSHVDNENFILRRRLSTDLLHEMGQNFARKRSSFFRQLPPPPQRTGYMGSRMTKASSYNELPGQFDNRQNYHQKSSFLAPLHDEDHRDQRIVRSTTNLAESREKDSSGHKVVIYFGDSISKRRLDKKSSIPDVHHASRLLEETAPSVENPTEKKSPARTDSNNGDVMRQLKSVLEEKNRERESKKMCEKDVQKSDKINDKTFEKREVTSASTQVGRHELPPFVESVINGVINIKIEETYEEATRLVKSIANSTNSSGSDVQSLTDDSFDWSFVQEWRTRPTGSTATSVPVSYPAISVPIQSPAIVSPALRVPKEIASRPTAITDQYKKTAASSANDQSSPSTTEFSSSKREDGVGGNSYMETTLVVSGPARQPQMITASKAVAAMVPERDTGPSKVSPGNSKPIPHRSLAGPTKLTVQSTPVKYHPPMLSSALDSHSKVPQINRPSAKISTPSNSSSHQQSCGSQWQGNQAQSQQSKTNMSLRTQHAHDLRGLHRVAECHSSSDENRSSGHASMSDTGHGSSSPGGNCNATLGPLPEDRLAAGVTSRSTRSRASTSHSRSRHRATPAKVPWGGSGLEDIKQAIQQLTMRSQTSTSTYSSLSAGSESSEPARRLGRYSSLETVNTNVTSADEFVWVDSHNRLVELQYPPWSQHCILRVIRAGRCRDSAERISIEAVPRLGYLLQRGLVRVSREIQRLSCNLGLCSKHEVAGAFKIVLCPALADSCIKACLRAATMFAVPGDGALKQSKSSRAGLQLPVGRFHRWMADARLGRFVHEYAAVYLTAGMENLLEEILIQSLPSDTSMPLTATGLEHAIAGSGDLWGLLQPYSHLNAGRIASGALTMPRWASQSSIGSGSVSSSQQNQALEPCLLTTCVGSIQELRDLVLRAQQKLHHVSLSHGALKALFYFMRCSQLEHGDSGTAGSSSGGTNGVQELCYERAYVVLPPLVEWLRVATSHAEYRHALLIDKDDIMQAARLLLPGVDCPPRPTLGEEELPTKRLVTNNSNSAPQPEDPNECGRRATLALAFRLIMTGRPELFLQASSLLPSSSRYDTLNHQGMTPLMIAAIRNDEATLQAILDTGSDPNIEVPGHCPAIHPETQHWTAVTFAACRGNFQAVRILLERGAHVEGGARLSEDKCTLTPLQVASGAGCLDIVALLLAHGAHTFLSTQQKDSLCFSGSAQRGCYSAISVAAAHGQRITLRKLLSHPLAPGNREVLSLEEMLAEGDSTSRTVVERNHTPDTTPALNKTQIKSLQEAMYHSAENNHLDITVELRTLGVPWTLHCWMHALAAAHELRLDAVIDQLLQDFLQVCPDDYSSQFVTECLPLLFNIFRYSKKEGTTLLLADIFATCFGWESIKTIKEPVMQPGNGSRIDPKFVNNPELSDVTFRVEGKIFYGHKIVLVTASPRFQNMLSSKLVEGNTPTVQINDIRYHIFELVMQFLYSGGCNTLDVVPDDILELMAAASFFQLDGLLRYTEARCSGMIDIDNVVAMYIHAKVYNAHKLMEYCQGFLLQNMVALLTYDDSVKRLLFAKKIPNHDVLSGLLSTLQTRIKSRQSLQNPPNIHAAVPVRT
ncbi:ankyrin repeat and BTB/POZ domain-containing protein 2 [Sergentomyia squamirostris]